MLRPDKLLKGATKKWVDIITADYEALVEIFDEIKDDTVTPRDPFRFTRYSFDNLRVVWIGQDPYYHRGEADGLSFSSRVEGRCPQSLERIFNVWKADGLIDEIPKKYDLGYLAAQGFLLLNTALTTRVGHPGSHIKIWSAWTDRLIKRISERTHNRLIWCLWGAAAQDKSALIDNTRHTVLTWCHPVAMVNPSFSTCDHFRVIATTHPDIIWDREKTETHFFTDAAAPGNQFKDCRAAWGVVCTRGLLAGKTWANTVPTKKIMLKGEMVEARPTNIRGECLALLKALDLAIQLDVDTRIVIHSDSKFWITDMLRDYIPKWIERGDTADKHKNSDLWLMFWQKVQAALAKSPKLRFQFVNAWHDRKEPAANTQDHYFWTGNRQAEEAAQSALPVNKVTKRG